MSNSPSSPPFGALDSLLTPRFSPAAKNRFAFRPANVDCRSCAGRGIFPVAAPLHCSTCVGTGLDPIPWIELFNPGRSQ